MSSRVLPRVLRGISSAPQPWNWENEARFDLPTLPVEAPPIQVELNVPVGQVALAALTHPSQRPLLTLMVAPEVAASSLNRAVPDEPVVEVGLPPQNLCAVSIGLLYMP